MIKIMLNIYRIAKLIRLYYVQCTEKKVILSEV